MGTYSSYQLGCLSSTRRKEGNVLFNDALNTFYLRLYGIRHMVKNHSFRLTARVLLYAQSHRQGSTYHGLCYTSRGALAGTRNSSMGPPHEGSIRRPIAPWSHISLPLFFLIVFPLFSDKLADVYNSSHFTAG